MRLTRIALPLVLAATLPACAANAGAPSPAEPAEASAAAGVTLLNRAEALRAMRRVYPPLMRDAGVTGEVTVQATLNADGTVASSTVTQSTQELFSTSALRVANELRFSPPAAAGERVRVRMRFELQRPSSIAVVP